MHKRALSSATSLAFTALLATALANTAFAQKKYDPGATDTEIKIGNIMPYSGPASAYGVIGKTEQAYFNKINAEGGINGRKIRRASWWKATRCSSSSIRSAPRRIRRSRNT